VKALREAGSTELWERQPRPSCLLVSVRLVRLFSSVYLFTTRFFSVRLICIPCLSPLLSCPRVSCVLISSVVSAWFFVKETIGEFMS
jgi:hypothetical protein